MAVERRSRSGIVGWLRQRLGRGAPTDPEPSSPPSAPRVAGGPRPALRDGDVRASRARETFASDPAGALATLEDLRRRYAPDPHVLHALCLLRQRAGDEKGAVAIAREAIPLCFRRRQGLLAAEIMETVDADAEALGLNRDQLLAIGGALVATSHWPLAVRALASVAMSDPGEARAIDELLRAADHLATARGEHDEALKICQFLALVVAGSPRAIEIEERVGELESRLGAPAAAPTGPVVVPSFLQDL